MNKPIALCKEQTWVVLGAAHGRMEGPFTFLDKLKSLCGAEKTTSILTRFAAFLRFWHSCEYMTQ